MWRGGSWQRWRARRLRWQGVEMPAPLDFTGQRIGDLLVISRAGPAKKESTLWECRCLICGTVEQFKSFNLRRYKGRRNILYTACRSCSQKTCRVCGEKFPAEHPSDVCPKTECKQAVRQATSRRSYERNLEWHHSPEGRAIHNERQKARYAALSPAEKNAIQARKVANKRAMTPEQRAEYNHKTREWYARYKAACPELYQRRREGQRVYMDALRSDPARSAELKKYQREWRRRWRAELRKNPDLYEAMLERMAQYGRDWYRRVSENPQLRAKYKQDVAQRKANRAQQEMFDDAQRILNTHE